jgi:hypothetical protein
MGRLLKRACVRWKAIAHVIGNFQARVLLTLFYFVAVPPFALVVRVLKDPLVLRPQTGGSLWVEGPASDLSVEHARRQF